jgi:hypothetical protein
MALALHEATLSFAGALAPGASRSTVPSMEVRAPRRCTTTPRFCLLLQPSGDSQAHRAP